MQVEVNDDNIIIDVSFGIFVDIDNDEFDFKEEVYVVFKIFWVDLFYSVLLLVNYEGGDVDDVFFQINYIFVFINGGMLYVIDLEDGLEKFIFMFDQFVKKVYDFVSELLLQLGNICKFYGFDGFWIVWCWLEINGNGERIGDVVNVYIYGGMCCGGDIYFGLDVSSIDSLSMMWQIDGGYDGNLDFGFNLLG